MIIIVLVYLKQSEFTIAMKQSNYDSRVDINLLEKSFIYISVSSEEGCYNYFEKCK